jgi:hypothetical protein
MLGPFQGPKSPKSGKKCKITTFLVVFWPTIPKLEIQSDIYFTVLCNMIPGTLYQIFRRILILCAVMVTENVVKSAFFIIFGIKIGRFWPTTRAQGLGFL